VEEKQIDGNASHKPRKKRREKTFLLRHYSWERKQQRKKERSKAESRKGKVLRKKIASSTFSLCSPSVLLLELQK
jgi:hypothetical protein